MRRAFGMFVLTRREQRVVVVIMLGLVGIALAKHYRDTGTIIPAQALPSPQMSATPSSLPDEERVNPDDAR
jgi:hypothetical protein